MSSPEAASQFFTKTMMGYRATKALLVANRIGVFDAIENGSIDAEALARKLACNPRALRVLLRALAGLDLLIEHDGCFRNSPLASEYLVRDRPRYVGNNLRFQDMLWEGWSNLESVVRTGRPWSDLGTLLSREDQTFTEEYIRGMHNIAAQPARDVARLLGPQPLARMIDVGAGPGTYALALLEAHPQLVAVLFDLPTTLTVTRDLVRAHPLADRLELRAGDYTRDELGSNFDLVLMSHVTHDEDADTILEMLTKAHRALRPGGRVAIHDWVVDESRCRPLHAALFSVNLIVYTRGGQIYAIDEYCALLGRAGFSEISHHPVLESTAANPTCLIVGVR